MSVVAGDLAHFNTLILLLLGGVAGWDLTRHFVELQLLGVWIFELKCTLQLVEKL